MFLFFKFLLGRLLLADKLFLRFPFFFQFFLAVAQYHLFLLDQGHLLFQVVIVLANVSQPSPCLVEILGGENEHQQGILVAMPLRCHNHLCVFLFERLDIVAQACDFGTQIVDFPVGQVHFLVQSADEFFPFADIAVDQLQFGHRVFAAVAGLVQLFLGLGYFVFQFLLVGFQGLPILAVGDAGKQQESSECCNLYDGNQIFA